MRKSARFHRIHAEGRAHQLRRRVALEAARLISEHGIRDYRTAKLKAAQRIGVGDESHLPRNREIDDALREHQRLFLSDKQPRALRTRREAAREAMRFLDRFEPRLVGAVLEGTADAHSAVCLHVFSDTLEEVSAYLGDRGIRFESRNRTLRLDRHRSIDVPVLTFGAGELPIDLTVLPRDALRSAPLDRIDDRRQRRATLAVVDALLAEDDVAHPDGPGTNG
jgi:hypothetical protein